MKSVISQASRKLKPGSRFGRLIVVLDKRWDRVECICDCGKNHVTRRDRLRAGHCSSCGCFLAETCAVAQGIKVRRQRLLRGFPEDALIGSSGRIARSRFNTVSRKVKERDNYTCALCGVVGGRIQTHHIVPWGSSPELRYDFTNLVSLCRTCHIYKAHSGNSRKNPDESIAGILKKYVLEKYCGGVVEKNGNLYFTSEEEEAILRGEIPERIARDWEDLTLSDLVTILNETRIRKGND